MQRESTNSIPLSATWFGEEEVQRVREALAGRVGGDGPFCRRVETRLAERLGVRQVLLTTSCTHALELALMALKVGPGQEVICPSFTFASTANAALRVGACPIFADIEEQTLSLDPADVERRITPRTAAILPVHYAGVAGEIDAVLHLAAMREIAVVEDAAQALGASLDGRPLGTLGDAGCFSFHETKNLTCGEGGALVIRDAGVNHRAEIIREKGTNRAAFLRGEVDRYTWVAEGSSFVLSDILAAILDAQLDKQEQIATRRANVAARYRAGLKDWAHSRGVRLPDIPPGRITNHHIFHLMFPEESTRNACLADLRAKGIFAAFHYVPLHSSPQAKRLKPPPDILPVTDRVASTLLRLPIHPLLQSDEIDRVIDAVVHSPG